MGRQSLRGLVSLLAPGRCASCGHGLRPRSELAREWRGALCDDCSPQVLAGACRGCGQGRGPHLPDTRRCAACRGTALRGVASTTALLRYRGVGRSMIAALKYGGRDDLARPLGLGLGRRFAAREPRAAGDSRLVVVPVPLHWTRAWSRGFNQAERVATGVAEALERPLAAALVRSRFTRPLHGVEHAARSGVLEGVFAVRGGVSGKTIALVDDIRTTGSTLREAARVLRRAGALRVDALVVGR
jgi:ComF family protein